jgi:hypothetical protein
MKPSPRPMQGLALVALLLGLIAGCSRNRNPNQATQSSATPAQAGTVAAAPPPSGPAAPQSAGASATALSTDKAPVPPPAGKPPAQVAGISVPAGSHIVVRISQTIDVKHAAPGERFAGTVAEPVVVDNAVAIPSGSPASGEVLRAHRRGRFKGASVLELTLTEVDVNGTPYRVDTSNLVRSKKGKGKRTAALIGGGAGLGMLIGGIATGGAGLVVGGLAGGGAGTLGAAFTGNRDLTIPAESLISFRLENGLTLTPSTAPAQSR